MRLPERSTAAAPVMPDSARRREFHAPDGSAHNRRESKKQKKTPAYLCSRSYADINSFLLVINGLNHNPVLCCSLMFGALCVFFFYFSFLYFLDTVPRHFLDLIS